MSIKCTRNLSFLRQLCGCYMYVQLLGGQNRYAFVWAVMINLPRIIARKCLLGGALRLRREAWYWKFVKIYWFIVFHILIWGLGALSVEAKPTKAAAALRWAMALPGFWQASCLVPLVLWHVQQIMFRQQNFKRFEDFLATVLTIFTSLCCVWWG